MLAAYLDGKCILNLVNMDQIAKEDEKRAIKEMAIRNKKEEEQEAKKE